MRPSPSLGTIGAVIGAVALLSASCGDGEDAAQPDAGTSPAPIVTDSPAPATSPATSPAATPSPSPPASPTPTAAPTPAESPVDGTAQTFIVGPQEPIEVQVGEAGQFHVVGRFDGDELPERLFLGVIPCENHDIDAATFVDADDDAVVDGFDDDFGPRIQDVNGEQFENVDDIWPVEVHVQDGQLTFTVTSSVEACGVPVVFDDTNGNGELDLDEQDTAIEPYGVAEITFV